MQGFGSISQTVVLILTAVIALCQLRSWRRQEVGKRRIELAEDTLSAFYEAEEVLWYVRNGFSYMGEATYGEPTPDGETRTDTQRLKDVYWVPVKRLTDRQELFSRLRSLEPRCTAHFGQETVAPFAAVWKARADVISAAESLIWWADQSYPRTADEKKSVLDLRRQISGARNEDDVMSQSLKHAIAEIEQVCQPYLRGDRS